MRILHARHDVDLRDLRIPAAGMLAAGVVLPLLDHPLGACPLRTATGIPCPLCGMTTSVTSTLQGDLGTAIGATPMGIVAVAIAFLVLIERRPRKVRVPTWSLPVALATMWTFQLFRFSVL